MLRWLTGPQTGVEADNPIDLSLLAEKCLFYDSTGFGLIHNPCSRMRRQAAESCREPFEDLLVSGHASMLDLCEADVYPEWV